ncbi:MAG TPA: hypothetical protein VEQ60_22800 [Longimicrobium sp.]|nr:hypothetical protein [Longimicrobium sp.]
MKKIRLALDLLDVESFPTASLPVGVRGTVRANAESDYNCPETHRAIYTCWMSCQVHCFHTMEYDGCVD